MNESTKAMLALIAIAVLMIATQTADYRDQVMEDQLQARLAQQHADQVAWRAQMLAATGERK